MPESSKRVVYAAIAANAAIAVAKFIAGSVSGSSALIAEAIHSVIDTGNECLLLVGLARSRRPADAAHPFGYGKEIYFWSLIVAIVLFGLGGGMALYEGFTELIHPMPLENALWAYVVLGIATLCEASSFTIAIRELLRRRGPPSLLARVRVSKDPSVYTVVFEDAAALAGLLVAFVGVYLSHRYQSPVFDAAASICIGCILGAVALMLAYESRGLLIGESAARPVVASIAEIIQHDPQVQSVRAPLTMHLAPQEVLLNIEVVFCPGTDAERQLAAVARIEDNIKQRHPEITRIFIEARAGSETGAQVAT